MKILGIDFTSSPSRRKPITCAVCMLSDDSLHFEHIELYQCFAEFEGRLLQEGPWIAGIDFPFGMAARFLETVAAEEWRAPWHEYVTHAHRLGRAGFRAALDEYRQDRAFGDKEHRRAVDRAARSISPQKLYGVPVGLMFFEGAARLLAANVHIPHLFDGDKQRIVVEAYPGVLARRLIGRTSYKHDSPDKQTPARHQAREQLLSCLRSKDAMKDYGIIVDAPDKLADDPMGDQLDALMCAVQTGWAWQNRDNNFGIPLTADPREGWIVDPTLI